MPLSEFYKSKGYKYGIRSWCKKCTVEYGRKYRAENKEKIAEIDRKYRAENKEKIAEIDRKYRAENKEKIAERNRKYQKELYAHYIIAQLRNQHIPINETTIELQRNRLLLKRYIREQTKNA